jgi:hypothetical protein
MSISIHSVKQLVVLNIPTRLNAANASISNMLHGTDTVAHKFEAEVNLRKQFLKYHSIF